MSGNVSTEFPDFDSTLPTIPGFEDASWHNDACPCMIDNELHLLLWVDFSDPQRSEFPEWRASGERKIYALEQLDEDNQVTDFEVIAASDDLEDIIAAIDRIRVKDLPKVG